MKTRKRHHEIIKGNKLLFKPGDEIQWTYEHTLNRKSSIMITKTGVFCRYIQSHYKDGGMRGIKTIFAYVRFEGNKNPSKIKITELEIRGIL